MIDKLIKLLDRGCARSCCDQCVNINCDAFRPRDRHLINFVVYAGTVTITEYRTQNMIIPVMKVTRSGNLKIDFPRNMILVWASILTPQSSLIVVFCTILIHLKER